MFICNWNCFCFALCVSLFSLPSFSSTWQTDKICFLTFIYIPILTINFINYHLFYVRLLNFINLFSFFLNYFSRCNPYECYIIDFIYSNRILNSCFIQSFITMFVKELRQSFNSFVL